MSGGRDFNGESALNDLLPKLSLLIVDDDDVAAEAVVRGLRKQSLDCPMVVAEDGQAALEILRGEHERSIAKPFVVFLDLNMPRMNGIEFLHELRADAALRATIVFILTTSGADSDRTRAYDAQIAGYLIKSGLGPQCSGLARFLTEYRSSVLFP
jgi:CheY-like chemotaxis protein